MGAVNEPTGYLTLTEAAQRLGVSTSAVRSWCDDGRLRYRRTPGGHRRVLASDVADLSYESAPTPPEAA